MSGILILGFLQGGFPRRISNDAGVNLMHDDFFGKLQPRTRLCSTLPKEKPDIYYKHAYRSSG
jgi:hypothetical protein